MSKYKIFVTIYENNSFWIVIDRGKFIRNPTEENLKGATVKSYNDTSICPRCREENNITDKSILYPKNACREKYNNMKETEEWVCFRHWGRNHQSYDPDSQYNIIKSLRHGELAFRWREVKKLGTECNNEKGTLGWLRKQQKIKAKRDGFDDIDTWLMWKADPFNILEKIYGKEFADWARKNKDRISDKWINAGCKTDKEYQNKKAQDLGFKDWNDRQREYRYNTGQYLPFGLDEDSSQWFGEFVENLMIHYYPGAIKMPPNNPGFDYLWKDEDEKEIKVNSKGRCLYYFEYGLPVLIFLIDWNNIADIFILSGWDNRESRNPLFALEFHKNDLVRHGRGPWAPRVEFWKRHSIGITYPEGLEEFRDNEIDIGWLKDIL